MFVFGGIADVGGGAQKDLEDVWVRQAPLFPHSTCCLLVWPVVCCLLAATVM